MKLLNEYEPLFLALVLTVIGNSVYCRIPAPFSDNVLPKTQRNGQWIEDLGHIMKLDTYLPPKGVDQITPKFQIFNRRKPNNAADIIFLPKKICFDSSCGSFQYDLRLMMSSGFDANKRTIVLINGYLASDRVEWMHEAKDIWLRLRDVNVILVTWKSSFILDPYSMMVATTPIIARQITVFIHYLAELGGTSIIDDDFATSLHIVGHSLGAHIAGYVGQDLNGHVGRITGLDPAGPSFDQMSDHHRLDASDAKLVDVIHTNSGQIKYPKAFACFFLSTSNEILSKIPLLNCITKTVGDDYTGEGDTAWWGINKPIGHLDYYANDGRKQPGCAGLMHICDHVRAHEIYVDFLRYQESLEWEQFNQSWNKLSHLLAFASDDYRSFQTGDNFRGLCPNLLDGRQHLDDILDATFSRCSMPIDLIAPVDEFREELVKYYNFQPSTRSSYFFKTNSQPPFVGDHNLLKIHLDRSVNWDESCALKIEILMNLNVSTTIEVNSHLQLVETGNFYGIALPFVNPEGAKARVSLTNIFQVRILDKNRDMPISHFLTKVLPRQIRLTISGAGLKSITETITTKLFNFGCGKKPSPKCQLKIKSVEVEPIEGFKYEVVGFYGSKSENRDVLPEHTPADRGDLMRKTEAQTISPASPVATRGLEAVIVG